ncbi:cysteinyl leukotriene receptor 1-like [Watersipora subatra]|uniref:cysteinyl leukotriene receptor 1-like n=1 Tax=Watersipora subatra TaxID=2589382 RepID=UPI00355C4C40
MVRDQIKEQDGILYCDVVVDPLVYYWIQLVKFLIPTVTIILSYSAIFITLCLRIGNTARQNASQQSRTTDKVLVMLAVDAALTVSTWLPLNIFYTLTATKSEIDLYSEQGSITDAVLVSLMSTNAFSTPVIYFIFSKNFRKDVKFLFARISAKHFSCPSRKMDKPKKPKDHKMGSSQSTEQTSEAA